MKKLISILLTFGMLSGTAFAAFTNPADPNIIAEKKGVGGRKMGDQAAVIMLVRNSAQGPNGVSIFSEDAVVYDTASDDGVTVRVTTTSADGAFAGIALTSFPSSDVTGSVTSIFDDWGRRNWGYILVHGKCFAKATAGGTNANAIGDIVITSSDSGAITTAREVTSTVAASTVEVNKLVRGKGGFFYDAADGTSTSYEVQIDKE